MFAFICSATPWRTAGSERQNHGYSALPWKFVSPFAYTPNVWQSFGAPLCSVSPTPARAVPLLRKNHVDGTLSAPPRYGNRLSIAGRPSNSISGSVHPERSGFLSVSGAYQRHPMRSRKE